MMLTIAGMVGCASILGATSAQAAPTYESKVTNVTTCYSVGIWNWFSWLKPFVPSAPQVQPDNNSQTGSDQSGNTGNTGNTGNSENSENSGNTGNTGNIGNTGNSGNMGNTENSGSTGTDSTVTEESATISEFAKQVADLVNQERAKSGLSPLTLDAQVSEVAMLKAKDMVENNYFSHQSPTYGSPFDMLKANGITYQAAGENIAKGQKTPEEVMNAWMNSDGHRKNIMSSSFSKIGVAYYNGVWVQQFIG